MRCLVGAIAHLRGLQTSVTMFQRNLPPPSSAGFYTTSVIIYQIIQRHIPKHCKLDTHCCTSNLTQDNSVSGLCPSFSIKKKESILENGGVSILRRKHGEAPNQLGPSERSNLNHWTWMRLPLSNNPKLSSAFLPFHRRMKIVPGYKTRSFWIPYVGPSPETQLSQL
jgi:hypothetical protein